MRFLESFKWRYATKLFDKNKKVSDSNIEVLKEAVQLSASSFGLQNFKVVIVENPAIREELKPVSWGQAQITDASHLFVFCNYTKVKEADVDEYIHLIAKKRGSSVESLEGLRNMLIQKTSSLDAEQTLRWTENQVYIAATNLWNACAEMRIDACPMAGFEASKYNEILGLTENGLNACLVVPVGYRSSEDKYQALAKVRKPLDELFITI